MRHYVTYFDRNYLAKGVAMLRSLAAHEAHAYVVFVVCMDELTRTLVERLEIPNVRTVALHEIERGDVALVAPRAERDLVEYYWTLTPTIILRLLERHIDIEVLTYLDADLYFFGAPDPIFDALGSESVLIHEHRFSSDLTHLAQNGRFNVGLLCFRNDDRGLAALRWWRDRCIEWCFKRLEDGKMGDQLYLEDWPSRFEGVVVLEHIGSGVAPWNHIQYRHGRCENRPTVNDCPVVFYHFHAFGVVSPDVFVPATHAIYRMSAAIIENLVVPYAGAVREAFLALQEMCAGFRFGLAGARGIDPACVLVARAEVAPVLAHAGLQQERAPVGPDWELYDAPQLIDTPHVVDTPQVFEAPQVVDTPHVVEALHTASGAARNVGTHREHAPSQHPADAGSERVSVVLALATTDCGCGARAVASATPDAELVVACPPHLTAEMAAIAGARAHMRIVVTEPEWTSAHAINVALSLCRGDVVVIATPTTSAQSGWLDEVLMHRAPSGAVRSASTLAFDRATLERFGGLCAAFADIDAALDDAALRMCAHRVPIVIERVSRLYPMHAWRQLTERWGIPEERGQDGNLPAALSPPPETLLRVAVPDVTQTHVLNDAGHWSPVARISDVARTRAAAANPSSAPNRAAECIAAIARIHVGNSRTNAA